MTWDGSTSYQTSNNKAPDGLLLRQPQGARSDCGRYSAQNSYLWPPTAIPLKPAAKTVAFIGLGMCLIVAPCEKDEQALLFAVTPLIFDPLFGGSNIKVPPVPCVEHGPL